ncbi:MAG: hypothetical protein LBI14_01045 [Treponema sp.]|jgi:Holliday junction resolvase-like predicted endonuclease|nr:hypothetical protein [Treponema sp.]
MEATQTNSETPNVETIWAILREVAESNKETAARQKETAARQEETDRQLKENAEERKESERLRKQEFDRQTKEFNERFGEFSNRFGEIVEYMVAPKLAEKFGEIDVFFEKAHQNTKIRDNKTKRTIAEADITLENGEKMMFVEVKTKLTTEDINEHIERLDKVRAFMDSHDDKRKLLGAVAGVVMTDYVRDYAFKSGFYVIEPSGETLTIKKPQGDYSIREW